METRQQRYGGLTAECVRMHMEIAWVCGGVYRLSVKLSVGVERGSAEM